MAVFKNVEPVNASIRHQVNEFLLAAGHAALYVLSVFSKRHGGRYHGVCSAHGLLTAFVGSFVAGET